MKKLLITIVACFAASTLGLAQSESSATLVKNDSVTTAPIFGGKMESSYDQCLFYYSGKVGTSITIEPSFGWDFFSINKFLNQPKDKFGEYQNFAPWMAFRHGPEVGLDLGASFNKYDMNGTTVKTSTNYIGIIGGYNVGFSFGLGKFIDSNKWKGTVITLRYRPYVTAYSTVTTYNLKDYKPIHTTDLDFIYTCFGANVDFVTWHPSNGLQDKTQSNFGFSFYLTLPTEEGASLGWMVGFRTSSLFNR